MCVCVCVCVGTCLLQVHEAVHDFNATKNGDFAKTTAFKVEKLALLRITLCGPVNQLGACNSCVRVSC